MLYVTVSSVVHAVRDGVQAENTQGIFFDDDAPVFVKRLKGGLPIRDAKRICDHVRERVGTQYTKFEALKAGLGGGASMSTRQFCSRLVGQAYREVGYDIVGNADYCTPDDLLRSGLLEDVQGCTEIVADAEFKFWQSEQLSPVDHSAQALSAVLASVRKIDSSVQSFRDIGHFVILHREHDGFANALLHSSGFLSSWRYDFDENPWRFDKVQIEKMQGIRSYCEATKQSEPRDDNRFTRSLAGLKSDFARCPRETLMSLIALYERLSDLHAKRVDAAAFWLEKDRNAR